MNNNNRNLVISIGRECGSGGHEIGEKLAAHYGIKLYDKNLIEVLAQKSNQDPNKLAKLEERVKSSIFPVKKGGFSGQRTMLMNKLTEEDKLYLQEAALLKEMAATESFVIVGRAANAILDGLDNVVQLYVYADEEFKLPRVKEFYHLDTDKEAKKKMEQVDKARRDYFNYYSDMIWGSSDGHDFMINSGVFGIDETVRIIIDLIDRKFARAEKKTA